MEQLCTLTKLYTLLIDLETSLNHEEENLVTTLVIIVE